MEMYKSDHSPGKPGKAGELKESKLGNVRKSGTVMQISRKWEKIV